MAEKSKSKANWYQSDNRLRSGTSSNALADRR